MKVKVELTKPQAALVFFAICETVRNTKLGKRSSETLWRASQALLRRIKETR